MLLGAEGHDRINSNNNPVNLTDPTGEAIPAILAAIFAGGGCEAAAGAVTGIGFGVGIAALWDWIFEDDVSYNTHPVTDRLNPRVKRPDGLIPLYHGTDVFSGLAILNGAPLSVSSATELKYKREIGLSDVGFYLTPDPDVAHMFALRRQSPAILQVNFTSDALTQVIAAGATVRPIPPGSLPKSPGTELVILPSAFPTFNALRQGGQITITPME